MKCRNRYLLNTKNRSLNEWPLISGENMNLTQDELIKTIQNLAQQVSQLSIDKATLSARLDTQLAENETLKQELQELKKEATNE